MAGSKKDVETVRAFFQHLRPRARRSAAPSSPTGPQGSSERSSNAFPARRVSAAWRTGCVISQRRFPRIHGRNSRRGSPHAIRRPRGRSRQLAAGIRADYVDILPSALACFEGDFEAGIAHLRLPVTHRRFARTINILERLFVEERRRLKIIPNGFGEKPVLKSCSARSSAPPTAGATCASPSSNCADRRRQKRCDAG
jgi:putative transposase